MESVLINKLKDKLKSSEIEKILAKNIAIESKGSIKSGLDINLMPFIKPKSGNLPLQKTMTLFNSIKSSDNKIEMVWYGNSLQKGIGMSARKFIPKSGSLLFKKVIENSFKEVFK